MSGADVGLHRGWGSSPLILQAWGSISLECNKLKPCRKLALACPSKKRKKSGQQHISGVKRGRWPTTIFFFFFGYSFSSDAHSRELPQRKRTLAFTLSWRWATFLWVVEVAFRTPTSMDASGQVKSDSSFRHLRALGVEPVQSLCSPNCRLSLGLEEPQLGFSFLKILFEGSRPWGKSRQHVYAAPGKWRLFMFGCFLHLESARPSGLWFLRVSWTLRWLGGS